MTLVIAAIVLQASITPVGGMPSAGANEYLHLVGRWRAGDAAVVDEIAAWPAGKLKRARKDLPAGSCRDDCRRAAALLHTEAAFAALPPQSYLYFRQPWPRAYHLDVAGEHLDAIAPPPPDAFRRDWMVAVGYRLLDWKHFREAQRRFVGALAIDGGDPRALIALGAWYELLDSIPQYRWTLRPAPAGDALENAQRFYERVLERDPGHAEARLRRARVWLRRGRADDGIDELLRLIASAPRAEIVGFAYLFLAGAHQDAGREQAALSAYRHAVAFDPANQTAAIALARALLQSGDTVTAVSMVEASVSLPEDRIHTLLGYHVKLFDGYALGMARLRAGVDR